MENVRDLLSRKGYYVWGIKPADSIRTALKVMKEKGIGAVLVLGPEGNIEGVFSERDFARACTDIDSLPMDRPVKDYMSKKILCVSSEQTIEECMALMTEKRIRHLPVLDGDKPVGIISIGDVVKAVIGEKNFLIDQMAHYISGSL